MGNAKFKIKSILLKDLETIDGYFSKNTTQDNNYENLNLCQIVAASHIRQMGFDFKSQIDIGGKDYALFGCDGLYVIVDMYGDVKPLAALYFKDY